MNSTVSDTKQHIKMLIKELSSLESCKNHLQDEVIDRILFLIELYIKDEVDLFIKKSTINGILQNKNDKENHCNELES